VEVDGVSSDVSSLIHQYAHFHQTATSLQTLMKTGRGDLLHKTFHKEDLIHTDHQATDKILMQVGGFLRHELPIRLAHRVLDLDRVPLMRDMKSVRLVKDLYITSFLELLSIEKKITTMEQENKFAKILEGIYERHASVLVQMARGAFELRAAIRNGTAQVQHKHRVTLRPGDTDLKGAVEFEAMEETHLFLDRFYLSRIGIRVLIGQYLALRQPPVENYLGIICTKTSPYEIVKRAIDDAAFMCARKYGDAPEVVITGRLDMTFAYVPTHLRTYIGIECMLSSSHSCFKQLVPFMNTKSYLIDYIMLELLKNSMRATVDWHGVDGSYPPIKVVIADGKENEDVVIKVSDEGGGIPRSNMKKIWSYLFTTADPAVQEGMISFNENVDHSIDSPLAGLGYGLPISRSYARYFGGDVSVMSMEGYGTDAFVHLTRLGNSREPLPV
jgi:pyruvate dehydrogenase kinase 2/3/4